MSKIDPASPLPLYYQLKEILLDNIHSGVWNIGELIPSENQLCEEYNISRNTAQRAIKELVQDGILSRRQGIGTFITAPKIEQDLSGVYSFTDTMIKNGITASSKVLSLTVEPAGKKHGEILGVKETDPLIVLTRIRYANNAPMMVETSRIPQALVPGLEDKVSENTSLYETFTNDYQIFVTRIKEVFEPVLTSKQESKWLQIDPESPAILLERTAYTAQGQAVEFCRSIVPGNKCRFYTEMR